MTIAVVSMIRDPWGGSEELWYEMGKLALKQGHNVIWAGYETPTVHPKIQELKSLGLIHISRPGWVPPSVSQAKSYFFKGRNFIRKRINPPIKRLFKYQPDIVIYNGTCYSIANEMQLLKFVQRHGKLRFFIIGHLNNQFSRGINEMEAGRVRKAYFLAKRVFFVSERSLDTAKRQLATEIPNAAIIRNPVNISSLELIPFPSGKDIIKLACVGNLVTSHKGQDLLFEALAKWDKKNWFLNIYGTGADLHYLKNLSEHFQLKDRIKFWGHTTDIRKVWEQNEVLVMPSIMEGMPLAVVEAMICGRVCIASDVGGISEWVTEEKNGFLISAPTVPLILKALETAWNLRDRWPEISRAAHEAAIRLYDPSPGLSLLNNIVTE
jgi:glycosyltransferase involved in cell wall biosynthesis